MPDQIYNAVAISQDQAETKSPRGELRSYSLSSCNQGPAFGSNKAVRFHFAITRLCPGQNSRRGGFIPA
jgi:hypothetical protein